MKRHLIMMMASLVLVLGLASMVSAKELEIGDTLPVKQVVESVDDTVNDLPSQVQSDVNDVREAVHKEVEHRRETVAQKRQEIKERVAEKRFEVDTAKCERNQAQLTKLMPKLSTSATTQTRVLDTMYDRVVGFYKTSQLRLSASEYEKLVQSIEQAKSDTHLSLNTATQAQVTVDCNANGIGTQLAEYRAAVADVKTNIRVYRSALVELIKALKAAPEEAAQPKSSTTEGTN